MIHARALGPHPAYPARAPVYAMKWTTDCPRYAPVAFTHDAVTKNAATAAKPWADKKHVPAAILKKRKTKRMSKYGKLKMLTIEQAGFWDARKRRPLNPVGRTGMVERGLLGQWGPNHAADPIVTRYRPGTDILEVAAVQRRDTGEYALPGGMCEDKSVSATLLTEFKEEALACMEGNPGLTTNVVDMVKDLFDKGGTLVYAGYVDDPRNTDQAWMESVVKHFHIDNADLAKALPLKGGDDASDARWIEVTPTMALYASHAEWISIVRDRMERRKSMRKRA